ncbi:hypothetical protein F0P96_00070 [Hymenobacter busanensis]|uniref:Uncharacterized protein n=1 Tax=Hymenobacter busanensis TaxID=2607656 RepID=A0A7L4ZVV6_9BACT|nr:DUF6687 family protein [Hymenobacter busanensis]KAA9339070.1 hypothetical protein F0P96_00070 [Hymenobacter busanensis]QHJ07167.1 hypothetical protein GUY19_07675 [Hymenobacter busanensis]
MPALTFLPFAQARRAAASTVVVDSLLPGAALTLAHWRGAPTPAPWQDDTSAGSVLRALLADAIPKSARYVTANHFDIDGFVGVWSLLNPRQARQHEPLLRLVATLGDFRELDWQHPLADTALQLVCWFNAQEQALFYPPFGAPALRRREDEASAEKFNWFLPAFGSVLENPARARAVWEPEYERVRQAAAVMQSAATEVRRYPEIGLVVVHTPEPLPYYALFGPTAGYDMVLSCYRGQRYEFEYKYTTWIDLEIRSTRPRLPLDDLVTMLNAQETTARRWTAEPVTDTGPLLRLAGKGLSKVQRYADPDQRPIYASSIAPEVVEREIVRFFQQRYAHITPRRNWTWEQIRAAGKMELPSVT